MYEDFKDHRDIMLNRQTDMLNIFNRHWAALKNHQKIKIALDVNEQIERLSYQLSVTHADWQNIQSARIPL